MAVQLVSDEVHVATGESWRHWFDDRSWDRIRELARAYGWKGATIEPGDYINEEEAASLADSLEEALPDIPDEDAVGGRTERSGEDLLQRVHPPLPCRRFQCRVRRLASRRVSHRPKFLSSSHFAGLSSMYLRMFCKAAGSRMT